MTTDDRLIETTGKLLDAKCEINRIKAENTKLGIDLTCAKSAIRQLWPHINKGPQRVLARDAEDAVIRAGYIIGEVAE